MKRFLLFTALVSLTNLVSGLEQSGCANPETASMLGIFASTTKILMVLFVALVIYSLIKNKNLKGGKKG